MTDSREITQHQPGGAVAPARQGANILLMVIEAARDPSIDANKVQTMADLAMKVQDREQQSEFNRALNAAIMEMPTITKAGQIVIPPKDGRPGRVQGHFAKFEDIDRVVRPILQRHNLAIRFEIDSDGGLVAVRPIISHTNGFVERGGAMKVALESSGSKNNVQAAGSSVSYAKRYTLCAALNIITEGVDDDGTGRGQVSLTHEREHTVLEGAAEAATAGRYMEFFNAQSPKDRAYLVQSGKHAEYGGPTVKRITPEAVDRAAAEVSRSDGDAGGPKRQTAEEWLADFKSWVEECRDRPELGTLEDRHAKALAKLRRDRPELGREADKAITDRRIDIDNPEAGNGDDLFQS